jgi:hypothetical protein
MTRMREWIPAATVGRMIDDIPWPDASHDLLGEDEAWWHVALLNPHTHDWYPYMEGYRRAAGLIAQHVVDTGSDQDFLIFPFAFAWRHYAEVRLKTLRVDLFCLYDFPDPSWTKHWIDRVWTDVKPLLIRAEPQSAGDIENVDRILKQLMKLDPKAEVFRYPVDVNGKSTHPGTERISITQFHEAMEAVAALLSGAADQVSVWLEAKDESERDIGP